MAGGPGVGSNSLVFPFADTTTPGAYNVSGIDIYCDGTNFYATACAETHGRFLYSANGTFVTPLGVRIIWLSGAAGGGGGGGGNAGVNGSGGGAGGTVYKYGVQVSPGTSYSITVGAAGSPGGANQNGSAGGNTVFGSLLTLTGGGGGGMGSGSGGGAAGSNGSISGQPNSERGSPTQNGQTFAFGGGCIYGSSNPGINTASPSAGYGAGGAGSFSSVGSGQSGAPGFLLVEW